MNKIKVSIIIPIYNSEKYLRECLDSIVNQTLKDIEIICVNDGSTDNSLEILNEYKEKWQNFKVINQENSGVISARIKGYENATGEYIGWVDSDDFVDERMFEKLYNLANKENSDVAICNYNFYPNEVINKKKWFNEYQGVIDWKFVNKNTVQWNKLVKKTLLDKMKITELFKNIGEGCYKFVLINSTKTVTLNECLYNYRVGQESLSSNFKNIEWYKKTVDRCIRQKKYAKEIKLSSEWQLYFEYVYLYYNLILLIVAAFNSNEEEYKKCRKIINEKKLFFKDKYKQFLNNDFSLLKIMFFKYVGIKSYRLMCFASKIILRK